MKIEVTITTLQRTVLEVPDDFPLYGSPTFTKEQSEIIRMGASTDLVARRYQVERLADEPEHDDDYDPDPPEYTDRMAEYDITDREQERA